MVHSIDDGRYTHTKSVLLDLYRGTYSCHCCVLRLIGCCDGCTLAGLVRRPMPALTSWCRSPCLRRLCSSFLFYFLALCFLLFAGHSGGEKRSQTAGLQVFLSFVRWLFWAAWWCCAGALFCSGAHTLKCGGCRRFCGCFCFPLAVPCDALM